jgi:hypothetical protein
MIFRCIAPDCGRYWHGHNSSATVQESLCAMHRRDPDLRKDLPVNHLPVKLFSDPIPIVRKKPRFLSHNVTEAVG